LRSNQAPLFTVVYRCCKRALEWRFGSACGRCTDAQSRGAAGCG
jgi:hypothetical protein